VRGWVDAVYSQGEDLKLQINGEFREFPSPLSLAALVEHLGMQQGRVAIELNREVVPRERWAATGLCEGDSLEIVHFVGGGWAELADRGSRPSRTELL